MIEWGVFGLLRGHNLKTARQYDMNAACLSLGLAWTGNIDANSFGALLEAARGRVSEIFVHPDEGTEPGLKELEALTTVEMSEKLSSLGIELVGYRELSGNGMALDSACGNI